MQKFWLKIIFIFLGLLFTSQKTLAQLSITVSIEPLKLILQEITVKEDTITVLMSTASAAHTHEIKPKSRLALEKADIVFWISPNLDGWLEKIPHPNKIKVFNWVKSLSVNNLAIEGLTNKNDPHFWTHPKVVYELLPYFAQALCQKNSTKCNNYTARAIEAQKKILDWDKKLKQKILDSKKKNHFSLFLSHPFLFYLAHHYEFELLDVLSTSHDHRLSVYQFKKHYENLKKQKNVKLVTQKGLHQKLIRRLSNDLKIDLIEINIYQAPPESKTYQGLIENLVLKLLMQK